jgi:hypothetical protein
MNTATTDTPLTCAMREQRRRLDEIEDAIESSPDGPVREALLAEWVELAREVACYEEVS